MVIKVKVFQFELTALHFEPVFLHSTRHCCDRFLQTIITDKLSSYVALRFSNLRVNRLDALHISQLSFLLSIIAFLR